MIGNKRYCSSCGSKFGDQGAPRAMSDIQVGKPTSALPQQPTPTSTSGPTASVSAQALHGQQVGGGPAVLDLRAQAAPQASPASTPTPAPAPVVPASVTPAAAAPVPTGVTAEAAASAPTPGAIIKPSKTIARPNLTDSLTAPKAADQTPAAKPAATIIKHPMVKRFPENPKLATAIDTPSATSADSLSTPAAAPTPISMPTEQQPGPVSPALQQVIDSAQKSTASLPAPNVPAIAKIGAAVAAIAIMGGLVWMQNSPKLAFRNAATQAGIQASLPTYVPSSYRQAGPAQVAPGQITLSFNSAAGNDEMKIVQRRTNWDSNSLRENFISRQTDEFVAVQGQGLTIYLYQDRASWVNHGVWYTVSGTSNLSREQVLKVAYGL